MISKSTCETCAGFIIGISGALYVHRLRIFTPWELFVWAFTAFGILLWLKTNR